MSCIDCLKASKRRWHGFSYPCRGCAARALSRSPQFRRIQQSGKQDQAYRLALQQMGVSHEDVKAAAAADKEMQS